MLPFMKIPISEFKLGTVLDADLYALSTEQKMVKFLEKGTVFTTELAAHCIKKKQLWLCMTKEDYALFVGFNTASNSPPKLEITRETVERFSLTANAIRDAAIKITEFTPYKRSVAEAANTLLNSLSLLITNSSTRKLLDKLEEKKDIKDHALQIALWTGLIARRFSEYKESDHFKIILCALFHDVGEIESKNVSQHTLRGRDILQSIPGLPPEAAIVAFQHHEYLNGGGYPEDIRQDNIHPFSRLVGVANHLTEILEDKKSKPIDAFKRMFANEKDFDLAVLTALKDILTPAA